MIPLRYLPPRAASAAENMATDEHLLDRVGVEDEAWLRFYTWSGASFTFGYSQQYAVAEAHIAQLGVSPENVALVRRPSGGGLVDHRAGYTYALVLPSSHPAHRAPPAINYRKLHEALQEAMQGQGIPSRLATCEDSRGGLPASPRGAFSICFRNPVLSDLVTADSGMKLAGAAVRRSRSGLLFQGSIVPVFGTDPVPPLPFRDAFAHAVAATFDLPVSPVPSVVSQSPPPDIMARYTHLSWNRRR